METHAHHLHKAPGKNFSHYFFEFFMLFLAVFCGFLAENFREQQVEEQRGRELAKSFYEELKSDSVTASVKLQNRLRQEAAIKYLISYFRDSSLTNVSKQFAINFEYGISFRTPSQFEPRTIMLEELRNSGSLRYFKNDELQKLTADITVAIKNIYDRQALETQVRMQYLNPIIMNYYDYDFDAEMKKGDRVIFDGVKEYEKSPEIIPFHLHDPDKIDRNSIIRILSFYDGNIIVSTRQVPLQKYIELNARLLSVLRKEYHLN